MQLGIFARTFARPNLEAVLDAVAAHGLRAVHFNLCCAGLPTMPERIDEALCDRIRREMAARDLTMASISGTYNMCHPEAAHRREYLRRLGVLVRACRPMGTSVITLCTGTRDAENMWRRHPANDSAEAWQEMLASVQEAIGIAEEADVTLAVEPEVSNVVDTAHKCRLLLDQVRSPRLKVVMDGANLFHAGQLPRMHEVLDEAFDLLGGDIILAHAKDLSRDGEAGHEAAGTGVLDYDYYLHLLRRWEFAGPILLHSLAESQVAGCVEFMRSRI